MLLRLHILGKDHDSGSHSPKDVTSASAAHSGAALSSHSDFCFRDVWASFCSY